MDAKFTLLLVIQFCWIESTPLHVERPIIRLDYVKTTHVLKRKISCRDGTDKCIKNKVLNDVDEEEEQEDDNENETSNPTNKKGTTTSTRPPTVGSRKRTKTTTAETPSFDTEKCADVAKCTENVWDDK
ncbi:unnamed protein product [Colias eurytheme]|nr:unnamed protein product [Colias eurytheme]